MFFDQNGSFSPEQQQLLQQLYLKLRELIGKALLDAHSNNKKLLLLAGESHSQLESFLVQMMLLIVVQEYGIKNLIVEYSEDIVCSILSTPRIKKTLNTEYSIPFAKNMLKMNLVPADLGISQLTLPQETKDLIRERNMIDSCGTVTENALFIVGSNHIKPMAQELKKKFHLILLNLSSINLGETVAYGFIKFLNFINPAILKYGSSDLGERFDFIKNTKEVLQINCPLNLGLMEHKALNSAIQKWYLKSKQLDQTSLIGDVKIFRNHHGF